MRKLYLVGIAVVAVGLLALAACVPFPFGGPAPGQQPYPYGPGSGMGPGMMGGSYGAGMMGRGWSNYSYNPDAKPLSISQVADAVQLYLNSYGGRLLLTEVMEFAANFYAEVEEKDTGIHAMELLIDKYTGQVYPEMGPNMVWNTKYGHMTGMMGRRYTTPTADMPVSPEQAKSLAQQYLDTSLYGLTAAEADTFYGYYTVHTMKNDQIQGMLSVNGYTGAVWYHNWHGPFIDMKEFE